MYGICRICYDRRVIRPAVHGMKRLLRMRRELLPPYYSLWMVLYGGEQRLCWARRGRKLLPERTRLLLVFRKLFWMFRKLLSERMRLYYCRCCCYLQQRRGQRRKRRRHLADRVLSREA